MMRFLSTFFKKNNKLIIFTLGAFVIIFAALSIYSFLQSETTTNQITENSSQFETSYAYRATVTPNILYPAGGTIDVGDTIFNKITTSIPLTLKSTIQSTEEVLVSGTHEVIAILKAGELWEREYPLEEKQSFEYKGTDLSIMDKTYEIDLKQMNTFIDKVEEQTEVRASQYTIEVIPNIEGTIQYKGMEKALSEVDKLVFEFQSEGIKLISEKESTSTTPFTTMQTIETTLNLFGFELPLVPTRAVSASVALLLLVTLFFAYRSSAALRVTMSPSQMDRINKKYGSRIISVSQKVNGSSKSFINLTSFSSLLKISDEKELPIFHHKWLHGSAEYFIVDGEYVYTYEIVQTEVVRGPTESAGSEKAYANG